MSVPGMSDPIASVRISLASPETIRSWSFGEVTLPETINFRSQKPEQDGLFCERIFGPTRDWTCFCRKYTLQKQAGLICEKCGVEVTSSHVRRERMGHIELPALVIHPWFSHGSPSILALLLHLSRQQCASVMAYTGYLVTVINKEERQRFLTRTSSDEEDLHPLLEGLTVGRYLDDTEYRDLSLRYAPCFSAETGAQGLHTCLTHLDLDHLADQVRQECRTESAKKKAIKRLQVVEAFRTSGVRPEWMVLSVLPVLPPDLRPLVPLSGGRLATSDVNLLYQRVLHRCKRVRHFQQHEAPCIILNQEKRLLQQAVDALIDNAHTPRPVTNTRKQALKSLSDTLSGKTGRFRLNLLGKRVDYSGRSVIVGNPQLHMHQCGVPKIMACELFKPFLIRKLIDRGLANTPKHAKRMVERRHPAIWDQLAECLFERVVLLNRAPTLHRLSILAFEPVLVEGSALHLHPQVCSAFNADFDGDQMAIHLPISEKAQAEARALLLSVHNLRSPASGDPSISISQEQVLGLYYLTEDRPSPKRAGRIFVDIAEAIHALETHVIDLHTRIVIRLDVQQIFEGPEAASTPLPARGRVETTVGRLLFNEALPECLRYKNYAMTKDALKQIVAEALARIGEETTAQMCDALKTLGFTYATKSGISFALSDIVMPKERETLIQQGRDQQKESDELYRAGEITSDEWYRQIIALWTETTDQISAAAKAALPPYGTLMTIVKSGATKAKFQQIRQLSGIRGLMASPTGKILPIPVLSNYLLGLLTWEIFIAASGARKGFMDRSLNTAMSGYLTRKLVEAGMSIWITMSDCGTTEGIYVTHEMCQRLGRAGMRDFVVGRVLAEVVGGFAAGTLLTEVRVAQLLAEGVEGLWIRSALTCRAAHGLCQQCYGRDPATARLVQRGTAVGVIAGQSIGEPGTQLTMRTFHSGGIANAQGDITQGLPRVGELFEARSPKKKAILSDLAGQVQIEGGTPHQQKRVRVVALTSWDDDYPLPRGATLLVCEQAEVQSGQLLARLQPDAAPTVEIRAREAGRVKTMTSTLLTLSSHERDEHSYDVPLGCQIAVEHGQAVEIGTPLTVGSIDPRELLQRCGIEATSRYLVNEVQRVYRNTGVSIRDQHPETIVRQMLRFVQVSEEGDTPLLPGAILDHFAFEATNASILAQGGYPAVARPLLLGLTRTILQTSSWIAAASFQETSRVITQAAIRRQSDPLVGFKEKIILGLPIPTWEG